MSQFSNLSVQIIMQGTSLGSGVLEYAAVEEKVEWGKLYEPTLKCMQFQYGELVSESMCFCCNFFLTLSVVKMQRIFRPKFDVLRHGRIIKFQHFRFLS